MNAPVDRAALASASLDDKYTLERGRVFLTGTQALIRLMMLQRERDARAGVNTAGFVSGYRGSPLGGLDQDRKSTRLNSSHQIISYAVFCLKKKMFPVLSSVLVSAASPLRTPTFPTTAYYASYP